MTITINKWWLIIFVLIIFNPSTKQFKQDTGKQYAYLAANCVCFSVYRTHGASKLSPDQYYVGVLGNYFAY